MVYPIVVIFVAGCIVGGIMYFIIPKFKVIFADFGVPLPAPTIALIAISDWVVDYWFLIPTIPIGIILFFKIVKKNRTGAYILDRITLKIPIIGKIASKSAIARTCRTLGTLISSGVPNSSSETPTTFSMLRP